jgi:hypothetical protein
MKTILITILLACALCGGACSRSDKQDETSAQPTPNQNVKSDAERLEAATAKVAKDREQAAQLSPTPAATQP